MTAPAFRSVLRSAVLAVAFGACAGCALFGPPPTPDARVAALAARLDAAETDSARVVVAQTLLAHAGVTPLAGERFAYGPETVVAGFVPGRVFGLRDTLVVVAASLAGPEAAVVLDAARRLVDVATRNEGPRRSVLVALWSPARTPADGLADVRAFPLWSRAAVAEVLVAGEAGVPVRPDAAASAALVARVLARAARPFPPR